MKYTLFSIDYEADSHMREAFEKLFEDLDTKGRLIPCDGSYEGVEEFSYLCLSRDFDEFVWGYGWVDDQESVLRISECNKQYARLDYSDFSNPVVDNHNPVVHKSIGSLKSVGREEALTHANWTYRPDLGTYWIAVQGNPDTVPPVTGW